MANVNVYEMITNSIIEQLNKGIIPWQKPWCLSAMAVSHTNGKPYSLLNQFLLENKAGEWLTFNQIKAAGGSIRKGEKAHYVVFWKFFDKTTEDEEGNKVVTAHIPMLKYYNVWHIDQVEGVKAKYPIVENTTLQPIEEAENIVLAYAEREGLPILRDENSDRAFYSPRKDSITVPKLSQYKYAEEYYSTLFHEMTHSTGAEQRLNRDGIVKFDHFGSEQYSKEELVAEMGAAFLSNIAGLDLSHAFTNSVAYIQSWLKAFKNDPKLVVAAASKAEQAAKFILTGERPSRD